LHGAVVSALRALLHPPRLLYVALYIRMYAFILNFWVNKVIKVKWKWGEILLCHWRKQCRLL